ncbi:MAG TPA: prepilin-type N-terminal cleavage/methylation domain-containing protein [Vulgatibacter sp.]|nr:prepilin-type N-terminal cleavage/methylation domain-containing protein [Vulgatibacter sp.]
MKGSRRSSGFTLLEVMVALAILALALTAIVGINGNAIRSHGYAKRVTVATMLARSKMADIESKYVEEGFTSEFDQVMEGNFEEEGWSDYRWKAEIVKPDIDAANATALVEMLVEKLVGDMSSLGSETSSGAPIPTPDMSGLAATYRPVIEGQVTTLVETMKQAVREVRLTVSWQEGAHTDSFDVVTHLVVLAPAGQERGESNDPALDGARDRLEPPGGNVPGEVK